MAVILGKRKRHAVSRGVKTEQKVQVRPSESEESADEDTARALFRRAFEAKFKPLERTARPMMGKDEGSSDDEVEHDDESDWSGLSDGEDEVEVVEHVVPELKGVDDVPGGGKKAFMSSKPPTSQDRARANQKPSRTQPTAEDGDEESNLKNDLDLQRLLKESHLLDPSSFRSSAAPDGKGRLKALDMRIQSLGAKSSLLRQEKMPLSHRKGIASKSASREANRRKEAAENGVILERAQAVAKSQKKRERGIGGPGVGKFRGGTLKLSSRDVASIQGERSGRGGRKGGKR